MTPSRQPAQNTPLKVLIVDDHPLVRKGLRNYLDNHAQFAAVAEAGDAAEALAKARELSPDLVLVDIELPETDGFKLTTLLREQHPAIKVILVSGHNPIKFANQIIECGASGFIPKASSPAIFLEAIQIACEHGQLFSPEITRAAAEKRDLLEKISPRERDVLLAITEGLANKEIADRLGVGIRTIETHRERIMRKLHIHTIAGLTLFAARHNLIPQTTPLSIGH
ncbi:MAG: DNA-binding response regulator [Verrucomicrobia bacterium]|nr:MAG: DNA-binding response regulator [Verrucomicrobiota bacterium]